eukprot:6191359-Pleurochrysis_carterae.AAC.17
MVCPVYCRFQGAYEVLPLLHVPLSFVRVVHALPCATRWHRIADFQKLSLKLIASGLLRGSSTDAPGPSDPMAKWLVFPGELSIEDFALDPPLVLMFSSFNPGAREVAKDLMDRLAGLDMMNAETSTLSSTSDQNSAQSGPLLLYLNNATFIGEVGSRLAQT